MQTIANVDSINQEVKTTRDYNKFKTIVGNREINLQHLNRLKESMKEEYLFSPIIVNSKYEVIDGQHRLRAAKELGLHVNYIICDNYGNTEIHRYNSNLKNWNVADFTSGYIQQGNQDYIQYQKFVDIYGFGHYESMLLLSGQNNSGATKAFREGNFKVRSFEFACSLADSIKAIGEYYEGYKRRSFVYAVLTLIREEKIEIPKLLKKLRYLSKRMVDCTNTKEYQNLLMEIYTYKDRK